MTTLIVGLLIVVGAGLLGVVGAIVLLRLLSHKCPNCDRSTMKREGKGYRCSNPNCDTYFTD